VRTEKDGIDGAAELATAAAFFHGCALQRIDIEQSGAKPDWLVATTTTPAFMVQACDASRLPDRTAFGR